MENQSYFKTVTSLQSNRSEYQLSKPIKSQDKPLKESDLALYQAARDKCANKQTEKLSTPLFQVTTLITNAAPLHKPTVKTTQFSNQPTSVFDFTDNRKEQAFKPHCIKVTEPGNNSDLVYKQQLKTSNLPNRENLYRNPITNGDPKSEYNRSTKTPFPKNQINFVG
ncbi:unnamed protein product (macronuclear) [Paramecium tetraurelia]|uniref:TPX2 central domain-containing protein n=1 Tax=Paramecium tetraurelia TaxID=5888 RepID=A0DAE7_PARTE|nr:uncharacterized protein GSPATT00014921001 [Paramecium tetraurelia]CAK80014.1 unnamed protein product [Paramecium tetraurelia]|eukprot:XP_001447411.1 hypothetical protein (macronuclear) [Paramecium tetraurelia strain d4-2]